VVWLNSVCGEITIELLKKKGLRGKVYVTFVVEKMVHSDIKVLRDIGYGTGKEAVRV
jgi:protein TonB